MQRVSLRHDNKTVKDAQKMAHGLGQISDMKNKPRTQYAQGECISYSAKACSYMQKCGINTKSLEKKSPGRILGSTG